MNFSRVMVGGIGRRGWPGGGGTGIDELVKVTALDTTPNYLSPKLVAGVGINLNILNPGANEQIQIVNSTTPINYREHNWRGGQDADIKITQNANAVDTWTAGSLNLWLRNIELDDTAITSISFETDEKYDGGTMALSMWFYDTDDGSLPDTKTFYAGVRLWNDGVNLLQAITDTSFTKLVSNNNYIYKATHTITPTGNTGTGKKYAILKIRRDDNTSGSPLVQTVTLRYGLA